MWRSVFKAYRPFIMTSKLLGEITDMFLNWIICSMFSASGLSRICMDSIYDPRLECYDISISIYFGYGANKASLFIVIILYHPYDTHVIMWPFKRTPVAYLYITDQGKSNNYENMTFNVFDAITERCIKRLVVIGSDIVLSPIWHLAFNKWNRRFHVSNFW